VEPVTLRLGGGCSIRLSYRGVCSFRADALYQTCSVARSWFNAQVNIRQIFQGTKTIAVVGLSQNPSKASHEVARYLMTHFKVIPVNPRYHEVLGLPCYPNLASIPEEVDMVDLFQRSENVLRFVQPSIDIGIQCFWMQLGIENALARSQLEAAGIKVVENLCTKVEHARSG
ncbi:MAG: CoA-binding protein, partial [bacterium]